mmetsp:Transcript_33430/g.38396  ORF Transcript_33430/g.38396 Transcript_33430/m.38396 type:complete len:105 (+) Transcript_33430:580-894(+)|eukprot:CAMPEP_0168327102 /NCGR_PEP_ID=MMETSP0213-20121227/5704_1 /TAXON_ID=151035 /ORGANISM="Euplotes harpa, Strain FSP1.4" /LENGTH=104 /DNA_ID=CAMNT_0008329955 /DNA_START=580 /DNA_END=894 /DNA_ORIENTATION=+
MDYILFAKKDSSQLQYSPNENEISDSRFVAKEEILDFLQAEIDSGESKITPWFNLILQSKLFHWWNILEDTGKLPVEDNHGTVINFMKDGECEKLKSLSEIKID